MMGNPVDTGTLRWLSEQYYDLNGTHYDVLEKPPSAIEFSRLVHMSRPAVIKGFDFPALRCWLDEYLIQKMGDQAISVAITPNGRADAVILGPQEKLYFVEPHTEQMTMHELLSKLDQSRTDAFLSSSSDDYRETLYLQSQNGNLYSAPHFRSSDSDLSTDNQASEFEALRCDVPSEVSWCSEAFGRSPDAVNIWIGDRNSITSIHNGRPSLIFGDSHALTPVEDPYENIYTVVRGVKHFTLLPPTEGWCLEERTYPHAKYARDSLTSPLAIVPSPDSAPVRWSSIANPHLPGMLAPQAHPIRISLHAGETLYLPAGWWHHVRQGEEELQEPENDIWDVVSYDKTIAINWWYDMEGRGMGWVWYEFLRGSNVPDGNRADPDEN